MNQLTNCPIESNGDFDVLVCGAGMGGITAACMAAEQGLEVCVLEYFGEPGGIPVNGALGAISGFSDGEVVAVAGFPQRFADELERRGASLIQGGGSNINLPPSAISLLVWELLEFYNIQMRLYTSVIDTEVDANGRISSVVTSAKEGLRRVSAKLFIDATGDGDLAYMAGAPYEIGRPSDGKVMSASVIFIIGGIDKSRMPEYMEVRKIWKSRPRPVPIDHSVFQFVPHSPQSNEIAVNMTHSLDADPLISAGLTKIRRDCMKQAKYLLEEFFRKEIPGYENAWISRYAPQVGVRESRRIMGDYILTEEDVLEGRRFEDEIACGIWGIDVHNPDGIHTGVSHYITKPYGIPYRCITPRGLSNLFIAGRPISADHIAHSSSRINATCMAIGEAAGTAAKEAIDRQCTRMVDIPQLKSQLANNTYSYFNVKDEY